MPIAVAFSQALAGHYFLFRKSRWDLGQHEELIMMRKPFASRFGLLFSKG